MFDHSFLVSAEAKRRKRKCFRRDFQLVDRYRSQLSIQGGIEWSEADWSLLWDHALLWRFIQEWLDLLAAIPLPVLATRAELLDEIWLQPVEDALIRRLGGA